MINKKSNIHTELIKKSHKTDSLDSKNIRYCTGYIRSRSDAITPCLIQVKPRRKEIWNVIIGIVTVFSVFLLLCCLNKKTTREESFLLGLSIGIFLFIILLAIIGLVLL